MGLPNLERALEQAANEGRNVLETATDDEASLIEALAAHLLAALQIDLDNQHYTRLEKRKNAAESDFHIS